MKHIRDFSGPKQRRLTRDEARNAAIDRAPLIEQFINQAERVPIYDNGEIIGHRYQRKAS